MVTVCDIRYRVLTRPLRPGRFSDIGKHRRIYRTEKPMTTITATPAKLRSGAWGARVTDPVKVGQTITITTKAGKTWDAEVVKIVWGGSDAALVATQSLDQPATRSAGRPAVGNYRRNSGCQQCRAEGRKCWQCAFDDE